MAIDPALDEAVKQAVREANQPAPVAARLSAWLKLLSEGDLDATQEALSYDNVLSTLDIAEDGDGH